jgi:3-oxoacyl-[acyl-carrier-protein] synthase III
MNENNAVQPAPAASPSFFDRPQVQLEEIPIGPGVPLGIECVSNPRVGMGGAYGAWGQVYDNTTLPELIERRIGHPIDAAERMNLSELGFLYRHHVPTLSDEEHVEVEVQTGARLLVEAAHANGWEPSEVEAVLVGLTGPATLDYTERIAAKAGIPDSALKVSIHKACDSSVGGLHLTLNPDLLPNRSLDLNLAEALKGKRTLVGGIEGLSRLLRTSRDVHALQLFGNGAGVIGVIPGQTMKFVAGGTHEVYDQEGLLAARMLYPHSHTRVEGQSMLETTRTGAHSIRVAGLMHEPEDQDAPVEMAGLMGMVKLFVRSGVVAVRNVYEMYQKRLTELGMPGKEIAVAIVHHANLKINQLKEKHLQRDGICLPMPWLLTEFGNVSAASNMIAFLRRLTALQPGDHVLLDGFGAGTYYDVLVVEMGG